MTLSPASIYNPHQAVWDEGYAAGLAAGRGAVETKTTKEFEEVKLDVAYLRRCLEYHVDYFGRVTTNPRQITVESQVINRVLKAIPTAPASGEGVDQFAPCRTDSDDSGMTVWAFEDCATFARDAFPGVHHFIDQLHAIDDGRLVGVQFWGPPPKPSASGEGADAESSVQFGEKSISSQIEILRHSVSGEYTLDNEKAPVTFGQCRAALAAHDAHIATLQTERDDALRSAADRESARIELSERFKNIAENADAEIKQLRAIVSRLRDDSMPWVEIKDGQTIIALGQFATPGEAHKLRAALKKADDALWPFKVYHDWAQASGFEGDADVELWANQSQFETDTPELQAGYFRRAAEAYAAIKQAKDSAS